MNWYLKVFKQYADFKGRARRKEYWMFALFHMIIVYGLIGLSAALEIPALSMVAGIYMLAAIIPSIAVTVRRMHDTGNSGWFSLIPIYSFVLACTDSVKDTNNWGENPKGIGNNAAINEIGKG